MKRLPAEFTITSVRRGAFSFQYFIFTVSMKLFHFIRFFLSDTVKGYICISVFLCFTDASIGFDDYYAR